MSTTKSSKRKAAEAAISPITSSDCISPPMSLSAGEQEDRTKKKLREQADVLSEELICSITRGLMVDPVMAEDGNTYERSAIIEWLQINRHSPLDPSQTLHPDRLFSNRSVLGIEKLVLADNFDEDLRIEWYARKKKNELEKAQQLFGEGRVLEAAKLGLPEAQARMAHNYCYGKNGFEEDFDKSFGFAKLAAEAGDQFGQFWLGRAYFYGQGAEKDFVAALKLFELVAEQGCSSSMRRIGLIYEVGGSGVAKGIDAAFNWFLKSADCQGGGSSWAKYKVGCMYYEGEGVAKDLVAARNWFEKCADQGDWLSRGGKRRLGEMLATGQGGDREMWKGIALLEEAASAGDYAAKAHLDNLSGFLDETLLR